MAWLSTPMPDAIARGATGGLSFNTLVAQSSSGHEYAVQQWANVRGRWNISQGLKKVLPDGSLAPSRARHEAARNHLLMARGRAHFWPFKDWTDYLCNRTHGRLVQITATTFQISKVYGDDPTFEYVRPLTRPRSGTVQVWLDGALQSTGFTVSYGTDTPGGVVTFSSAPGGAVREVACEFYVPCRYDVDGVDARLVHRRGDGTVFVEWDGIDIVEWRE
jgi:uncharacterized protein (TIGR02217 family)